MFISSLHDLSESVSLELSPLRITGVVFFTLKRNIPVITVVGKTEQIMNFWCWHPLRLIAHSPPKNFQLFIVINVFRHIVEYPWEDLTNFLSNMRWELHLICSPLHAPNWHRTIIIDTQLFAERINLSSNYCEQSVGVSLKVEHTSW